jgi:hypothetical protein
MNRADFLKRLGLGAIGIAVVPKVISENGFDNQDDKYKIRYLDPPNIAFKYREELLETDTYCVATTEEPNYMIGADPYVGDYIIHDGIKYMVVVYYKGYVTLRPLHEGEDKEVSVGEFKNNCVVLGNCFMT